MTAFAQKLFLVYSAEVVSGHVPDVHLLTNRSEADVAVSDVEADAMIVRQIGELGDAVVGKLYPAEAGGRTGTAVPTQTGVRFWYYVPVIVESVAIAGQFLGSPPESEGI